MAVIKEEFYFPSANTADKVRGILWTEESIRPRAVLQIIHGMCEYSDRLYDLPRFWCKTALPYVPPT